MAPAEVVWDRTIQVPFAPETPASGIKDTAFFSACWYRQTIATPARDGDERLFLRFGAVDYAASG